MEPPVSRILAAGEIQSVKVRERHHWFLKHDSSRGTVRKLRDF
jgi:hypothetical protein